MTEPIMYTGTRGAKIYELNANERPNGASTIAYSGLKVYGFNGLELTFPPPVKKTHVGNDRVLGSQQFPATDPTDGKLLTAAEDLDIIAAVSGTSVNADNVAGASFILNGTDKQGTEPSVMVLAWQAGIGATTRNQIYHWQLIYNTTAIALGVGMGADPINYVYELSPNPTSNHPYGIAISEANDGASTGTVADGFTSYPLNLAAFVADGTETEFLFPATEQAANATDISVFLAASGSSNLVEVSSGITKATTGVTWEAAPSNTDEILIVYQMAV